MTTTQQSPLHPTFQETSIYARTGGAPVSNTDHGVNGGGSHGTRGVKDTDWTRYCVQQQLI